MFLKKRTVNNTLYWSLAENQREGKKVKQIVIENLGKTEKAWSIIKSNPEYHQFIDKIKPYVDVVSKKKLRIAVLFDGAGLARLGLEQAGHECVGFELDPMKHMLSRHVGSGNCVLADATQVDLSGFDAVWASPPCQVHSIARTQGAPKSPYSQDYLEWSLSIDKPILWVENVVRPGQKPWGKLYNAAQFLPEPIQNRNRMIGGRYKKPKVFRRYKRSFPGICPAITATEYKGCATDKRRASRFYGRKLTIEEAAFHQGFEIPEAWYEVPEGFTKAQWYRNIYEAIGNGVPVYMAKAFGEAYSF
jgi:site-specific DNA-cytosine methylase